MDLKEEFVKLIERQNIEVQKVKGGGKVIYKVNGSFLYITFSKNLGTEQKEKYFLQVNEKKIKNFSKEELFILLICGAIDNIFVIPSKKFLDMIKDYKVAKDGNWKINIEGKTEVIKIQEEYEITLGKNKYPLLQYKNKFDNLKAKEETIKKIIFTIQNLQQYKLKEKTGKAKLPEITYHIEIERQMIFNIIPEKIIQLAKSGEGRKFEKLVLLFFKYLGFEIDEVTSGKSGELDIICLSPFKIGIECRSTGKNVGVNIIDELKRHVRRYEEKNGYERNSFKGLIVGEDTTKQFNDDCKREKCFSLRTSTFVNLLKLTAKYHLSPIELEDFFKDYGSIDDGVANFIENKERKIKMREIVINILKEKSRPLNYHEIKVLTESKGFKEAEVEEEINKILIELSSPINNIIRKIEDKYELIRVKEHIDEQTIQELNNILR